MSRKRVYLCAVSITLALIVAPSSAVARAHVPQGFVGMMVDGKLLDPHFNLGHQLDVMVATGVESLRVVFNWAAAEPYATWADVPPSQMSEFENVDNVPMSFAVTDRIVALAAQRGLSLLPVILVTPAWASAAPRPFEYSIPSSNDTYGRFAGALAARYGQHGTFWATHPKIPRLPIRMWQIWNEPNLDLYWPIEPSFAPSYVELLRAAHDAIKHADPGAKVVLAGMPNFVWQYLAEIYNVPGARRLFDAVAVHPFTADPAGIISILQRVRDVMNSAGDATKPILATEVSFPSAVGKTDPSQLFGFETTEAGQASKLGTLLKLLAADRKRLGLIGFYHYSWSGFEHRGAKPFAFAGLFRITGNRFIAKPAYDAFRRAALAIEGCRVKVAVARSCRA